MCASRDNATVLRILKGPAWIHETFFPQDKALPCWCPHSPGWCWCCPASEPLVSVCALFVRVWHCCIVYHLCCHGQCSTDAPTDSSIRASQIKKCNNVLGFCCMHKLLYFIHTTFIILIFQWGTRLREINNLPEVTEAEGQHKDSAANLSDSKALLLHHLSFQVWDSGEGIMCQCWMRMAW